MRLQKHPCRVAHTAPTPLSSQDGVLPFGSAPTSAGMNVLGGVGWPFSPCPTEPGCTYLKPLPGHPSLPTCCPELRKKKKKKKALPPFPGVKKKSTSRLRLWGLQPWTLCLASPLPTALPASPPERRPRLNDRWAYRNKEGTGQREKCEKSQKREEVYASKYKSLSQTSHLRARAALLHLLPPVHPLLTLLANLSPIGIPTTLSAWAWGGGMSPTATACILSCLLEQPGPQVCSACGGVQRPPALGVTGRQLTLHWTRTPSVSRCSRELFLSEVCLRVLVTFRFSLVLLFELL